MKMNKDPAFLFYSQDFFLGTALMDFEDKGKYITILCLMHQKGNLCEDKIKKVVGEISQDLANCFKQDENGLWYNEKLTEVMSERSTKSKKNKLIGTFAYVLKKLDLDKKTTEVVKKKFNVDKLLKSNIEWNTERLTEWCQNAIAFIENENEDINKNVINLKEQDQYFNNLIEDVFPNMIGNSELYIKWTEWVDYRRIELKKKLTKTSAKKQLKLLSEDINPIAVIESSITNSYQGLFKTKGQNNNGTDKQNPYSVKSRTEFRITKESIEQDAKGISELFNNQKSGDDWF